jgi:hypothetical protein
MLSAEDTAEGVGRKKKNSGNPHLIICSIKYYFTIHPYREIMETFAQEIFFELKKHTIS